MHREAGNREWEVLLVGGPSGCGKSSFAYPFAEQTGLALTEADDLFITAETLTSAAALPDLHYFRSHPRATAELTPEEILEAFIRTCRALTPAVEAVVANHLQTERPLLLEGDYLLPELVGQFAGDSRVRFVCLIEAEEEQIVANYLAREPGAGRQDKRAAVSRLYGQWLRERCAELELPALDVRPWETLQERVLDVLD